MSDFSNDLISSMKSTLFDSSFEIASDYAELTIDTIFDNEIVKEIPIVKTLTSICKIGYNIHERNLLKQTVNFIIGFNSNTIPQEKIDKYRVELENNPKKAGKELNNVVVILNNYFENMKSQVLGSFYNLYVSGNVSWEKFCELSEANNRIFVSDYNILYEVSRTGGVDIKGEELYQVERLISLGLLQKSNRLGGVQIIDFDNPPQRTHDVVITSFGETFIQGLVKIFECSLKQ